MRTRAVSAILFSMVLACLSCRSRKIQTELSANTSLVQTETDLRTEGGKSTVDASFSGTVTADESGKKNMRQTIEEYDTAGKLRRRTVNELCAETSRKVEASADGTVHAEEEDSAFSSEVKDSQAEAEMAEKSSRQTANRFSSIVWAAVAGFLLAAGTFLYLRISKRKSVKR